MIYESIENDVLTRLQPLTTAHIDVIAMPENQSIPVRPQARAMVIIQYLLSDTTNGSEKVQSKSSGVTTHDELVFIEVTIRSKNLRGAFGIYNIHELCQALLLGFTPGDCDKMLFKSLKFIEYADGLWTYLGHYCATRNLVEKDPADVEILLNQLKLLNENGDEIIQVPEG